MVRTRFAPSPTGSLHLGSALSAVANRRRGDWMLLRIDDTDRSPERAGAVEEQLVADLEWLGIVWNEGPSGRATASIGTARPRRRDAGRTAPALRRDHAPPRPDGSPTYHLASVVDDLDFGITHVIRGNDHRPNTSSAPPPARGARDSSRPSTSTTGCCSGRTGRSSPSGHGVRHASPIYREQGIPPEAVRAYLEELGLPRARRPPRRAADPAARDRRDRGAVGRGARRARRRAAAAGPRAARRPRPGRGAARWRPRSSSRSP